MEELVCAILGIVGFAKSSTLINVITPIIRHHRILGAFARPARCFISANLVLIVSHGGGEAIIATLKTLINVFTFNCNVRKVLGCFGFLVEVCTGTFVGTGEISTQGVTIGAIRVTVALVIVLTHTLGVFRVARVTLTGGFDASGGIMAVYTMRVFGTSWRGGCGALVDVLARAQVVDAAHCGTLTAKAIVATIGVITRLDVMRIRIESKMLTLWEAGGIGTLVNVCALIWIIDFIYFLVSIDAIAIVAAICIFTISLSAWLQS